MVEQLTDATDATDATEVTDVTDLADGSDQPGGSDEPGGPDQPDGADRPGWVATALRSEHLRSAFVALLAGAALVLGAAASASALVGVVAALQAALLLAWVYGTRIPGREGALLLGALAAAAADTVVMVWPHGQLGALVGVLAFVQIAAFAHQLARGVARSEIVASLGRTELALIAVIALAALLPLRHSPDGRALCIAVVLATAAALVEGHLIDLAWTGPRFDADVARGLLAAVVSVVVSGAISYAWLAHEAVLDHGQALILGAALGVLTGLFAVAAAFVLQNLGPGSRWDRPVIAVLLPLALLAPAGYLLVSAVQG